MIFFVIISQCAGAFAMGLFGFLALDAYKNYQTRQQQMASFQAPIIPPYHSASQYPTQPVYHGYPAGQPYPAQPYAAPCPPYPTTAPMTSYTTPINYDPNGMIQVEKGPMKL